MRTLTRRIQHLAVTLPGSHGVTPLLASLCLVRKSPTCQVPVRLIFALGTCDLPPVEEDEHTTACPVQVRCRLSKEVQVVME